jgi:hypothetical protein
MRISTPSPSERVGVRFASLVLNQVIHINPSFYFCKSVWSVFHSHSDWFKWGCREGLGGKSRNQADKSVSLYIGVETSQGKNPHKSVASVRSVANEGQWNGDSNSKTRAKPMKSSKTPIRNSEILKKAGL